MRGGGNVRVPNRTQFLHGSEELLRSHLHFDFLHWSQALLLRLRTCFSPPFKPDIPAPPLSIPADPYPLRLTPEGSSVSPSSSASSS